MAKRDPYWMKAKWAGVDRDGLVIEVGNPIFYDPNTKVKLIGSEAKKASDAYDRKIAAIIDQEEKDRIERDRSPFDHARETIIGSKDFSERQTKTLILMIDAIEEAVR